MSDEIYDKLLPPITFETHTPYAEQVKGGSMDFIERRRKRKLKVPISRFIDPDVFNKIYFPAKLIDEVATHPGYNYEPDTHPERDQQAFMACNTLYQIIFGGNQTGKTKTLAEKCLDVLLGRGLFDDGKARIVWVISSSYENIQNGVYRHLFLGHPNVGPGIIPKWRVKRIGTKVDGYDLYKWIELDTGSRIHFYSAKNSTEARRAVQTQQVDIIAIDEEIQDGVFQELRARLISSGGQIWGAMTSVEGANFAMDIEERFERGDPDATCFYFSAIRAAEKGHASMKMVQEILKNGSPEEINIRIHGKTTRQTGLIYQEFSVLDHTFPETNVETIPKSWPRFMAMDPGLSTTAILWGAQDPNGRIYIYRERYLKGYDLDDIASEIRRSEGWVEGGQNRHGVLTWSKTEDTEEIVVRVLDPAEMSGKNVGGGIRVGERLALPIKRGGFGLLFVPANNKVEYGILVVKSYLKKMLDGQPKLMVSIGCQEFLKERARYRRRQSGEFVNAFGRTAQKPLKRYDHLMDALRYLIVFLSEYRYRAPVDRTKEITQRKVVISTPRSNPEHEYRVYNEDFGEI